jgi:hypothetical protein
MTIVRRMRVVPVVLVLAAALAGVFVTPGTAAQKHCRAGVLHPVGTQSAAYAAVVKHPTRPTGSRPARRSRPSAS